MELRLCFCVEGHCQTAGYHRCCLCPPCPDFQAGRLLPLPDFSPPPPASSSSFLHIFVYSLPFLPVSDLSPPFRAICVSFISILRNHAQSPPKLTSYCPNIKSQLGAEETALSLRAPFALAEDRGLVPSTCLAAHSSLCLQFPRI